MLTGEGFSKEEADEIFQGRKPLTVTAENRQKHLSILKNAAIRIENTTTQEHIDRNEMSVRMFTPPIYFEESKEYYLLKLKWHKHRTIDDPWEQSDDSR